MPRIVTQARVGPKTRFARDALDQLTRLRALPALPPPLLQLPIQFGAAVAAEKTSLSDMYPSGYVIHCLIRKPGYVFAKKGERLRCAHAKCPFPSSDMISTGEVCQIELHHADLVITDEIDAEVMAKFHRRIEIHATTPAFHPNIGEPKQQYCLGYPPADQSLFWFLDQVLAMVGWHGINPSTEHKRNAEALAYYNKLMRERGSAAIGAFFPLYRGLL